MHGTIHVEIDAAAKAVRIGGMPSRLDLSVTSYKQKAPSIWMVDFFVSQRISPSTISISLGRNSMSCKRYSVPPRETLLAATVLELGRRRSSALQLKPVLPTPGWPITAKFSTGRSSASVDYWPISDLQRMWRFRRGYLR